MICPSCASYNTYVVDSREKEAGVRRRRYVCLDCGKRFNTRETAEEEGGEDKG